MNKELENAVKEHVAKRVGRWFKSQLFGKKSVEENNDLYELVSGGFTCFATTNKKDAYAIYELVSKHPSKVWLKCNGLIIECNDLAKTEW